MLCVSQCYFNKCRICSDIPALSWYWWFVFSLFVLLSVLLKVYQFYWFFFKNQLFVSLIFSVFLFSISPSFLYWKSTRQEKKSFFALIFFQVLGILLYLFFILSVSKKGSFFLFSKAKSFLLSFASVFSSRVMPNLVTLLFHSRASP